MLADEIKTAMIAAMKAGNALEKNILRLALSEIQAAETRSAESLTDEQAEKIVRKLVKSNEETLALVHDEARVKTLKAEIDILARLLPKTLDADAIVAALEPVADQIRGAPGDGPATGIAMKHLKGTGATIEGKDVAAAVKRLRS